MVGNITKLVARLKLLPQKDALESMLADATRARDDLQGKLDTALASANSTAAELEEARKSVTADKSMIEAQLGEIAQLNRDLKALRELRTSLEKRVFRFINLVMIYFIVVFVNFYKCFSVMKSRR